MLPCLVQLQLLWLLVLEKRKRQFTPLRSQNSWQHSPQISWTHWPKKLQMHNAKLMKFTALKSSALLLLDKITKNVILMLHLLQSVIDQSLHQLQREIGRIQDRSQDQGQDQDQDQLHQLSHHLTWHQHRNCKRRSQTSNASKMKFTAPRPSALLLMDNRTTDVILMPIKLRQDIISQSLHLHQRERSRSQDQDQDQDQDQSHQQLSQILTWHQHRNYKLKLQTNNVKLMLLTAPRPSALLLMERATRIVLLMLKELHQSTKLRQRSISLSHHLLQRERSRSHQQLNQMLTWHQHRNCKLRLQINNAKQILFTAVRPSAVLLMEETTRIVLLMLKELHQSTKLRQRSISLSHHLLQRERSRSHQQLNQMLTWHQHRNCKLRLQMHNVKLMLFTAQRPSALLLMEEITRIVLPMLKEQHQSISLSHHLINRRIKLARVISCTAHGTSATQILEKRTQIAIHDSASMKQQSCLHVRDQLMLLNLINLQWLKIFNARWMNLNVQKPFVQKHPPPLPLPANNG